MCGIAGFQGSFSPDVLTSMIQRLSHRGPDDEGIWSDPRARVGLAHRRLSILDLSPAGHQPMWDRDKQVCITYNGEIFNFRQWRELLQKKGITFRGHSDTEVLLYLYLTEGRDFLTKLNGFFALGLWDSRSSELLVARDGVGIKPLYYTETPGGFLFASELKALLSVPGVDKTLSIEGVRQYLTFLWSVAPATMLEKVHKLEPGWALVVKEGKIRERWRFHQWPRMSECDLRDGRAAAEGLRAELEKAVERQMVSDVPVGAFLSGGVDSSAIAALARRHSENLKCFTIGFKNGGLHEEGFTDDLPFARRMAEKLNVKLETVWVESDMIRNLPEMIYHLDEPQADPAALHVYSICKLARENGIPVLLSGAGGDDLFSGYRRHRALLLANLWRRDARWMRSFAERLAGFLPGHPALFRRLSKIAKTMAYTGDQRLAQFFVWTDEDMAARLLKPSGKVSVQGPATWPLLQSLAELPEGTDALSKMLDLETRHFLADHNLNYVDKMSMATGVEVRVPFLDLEVIKFAARIPSSLKMHWGSEKWILKKSVQDLLPGEILTRPKTGFAVPLRKWMNHDLKEIIEDTLSARSLGSRGLFEPSEVARLLDLNRAGAVDGAYTIFSLICIELWCRIFIDGGTAKFPVPRTL